MKNERIVELNRLAAEWGCSVEEALVDVVFGFYEAAGFDREPLATELSSKSSEELLEMYCGL